MATDDVSAKGRIRGIKGKIGVNLGEIGKISSELEGEKMELKVE